MYAYNINGDSPDCQDIIEETVKIFYKVIMQFTPFRAIVFGVKSLLFPW